MDVLNFSGSRRLPVILQTETAECGLACFAMISSYHGNRQDLVSLRQKHGADPRGSSLSAIMELASAGGFATRALRGEIEDLRRIRLPAIVHWDFNHFVVLKRVSGKRFVIHDPARGVIRCSPGDIGKHFTGIALELMPDTSFRKTDNTGGIPGPVHYLSGSQGLFPALAQLLFLSALIQTAVLAMPLYLQLVVDQVLMKNDVDLLTLLAFGFFSITVISLITRGLRGLVNLYLTHQLAFTLGTRLFHHLLHLPAGWFSRRHMGDIVSRFASLRPLQDFITGSAVNVLLDGIMAVTTLIMVFWYSPLLAGVLSAAIALQLIAQVLLYLPLRDRTRERIVADARADSHFMESIRTISAIKRFSAEPFRESDWQNRFADSINARIRVDRLGIGLELLDTGISGLCTVAIVYLGARQVLDRELTVGMLYAFLAWRNHLANAASSLVTELIRYLMLSLHMERLADIQLAEPEPKSESVPVNGHIAMRQGAFRHSPRDPFIISDCSFSLGPGESMAIFGPSGCGKTTLLALMQNLLELERGELLIDNRRIHDAGICSLRRASAGVMQEDTLLAGSLHSNITFNDPFPDWHRVQAAAETACIHDEIMALPMGYETLVGEMGSVLSAGQRQRILIARALYRKPAFLFLDEGTAHLDEKTEIRLMRQIVSRGMTCVFTTHNRKLLTLATKVMIHTGAGWKIQRPRKSSPTSQSIALSRPKTAAPEVLT